MTTGVTFPADAKSLVVAGRLDFSDLKPNWTLCLAEMHSAKNDLGALARRERGFVEKVNEMSVAWSPRNMYLLLATPQMLGFFVPADRQMLERWVQSTIIRPRTFPPQFADRALFHADRKAQVALALDLKNAISPELARQWLSSLSGVAKMKTIDTEALGRAYASAKSAALTVEVGESIEGTLRIDFMLPIDYGKTVAKDVVIQLLEDCGASVNDISKWSTDAQGTSITLSGQMSKEGLRRILSLVEPPVTTPETPSGSAPLPAPTGPTSVPAPPSTVEASQSYFRAVTDLLDGLKHERSNSHKGMSLWYDRYAKRIDALPLLGVDNELLDWGMTISKTLREMSAGVNYNAKDQTYRISGLSNYTGGYYYGYSGDSKAYNASVIRKQGDAVMDVQMDQVWKRIDITIAEMRRKMVEKYKVDF
jgi:hypothetical protein